MHVFCKSQLLRELIFLFEEHQQQWAGDLHDLFLGMLRWVQQRKARDALVSEAQVRKWERQYWKVLRAGRRANPRTPEQKAPEYLPLRGNVRDPESEMAQAVIQIVQGDFAKQRRDWFAPFEPGGFIKVRGIFDSI